MPTRITESDDVENFFNMIIGQDVKKQPTLICLMLNKDIIPEIINEYKQDGDFSQVLRMIHIDIYGEHFTLADTFKLCKVFNSTWNIDAIEFEGVDNTTTVRGYIFRTYNIVIVHQEGTRVPAWIVRITQNSNKQ